MNYLIPVDELTADWLKSLTPAQRHMIIARSANQLNAEWIQFKKLLNMGPEPE